MKYTSWMKTASEHTTCKCDLVFIQPCCSTSLTTFNFEEFGFPKLSPILVKSAKATAVMTMLNIIHA